MATIRLLLADDHQILLDGLQAMFRDVPEMQVVTTARNGSEVLLKLASYYVDILMMDIQMPGMDGYETAKIVREKYPETKILILSLHHERILIERMYKAGISGYILKSAGKDEIITAINRIFSGGTYYSEEITTILLENNNSTTFRLTSHELTKREKEILSQIASGLSNAAMAEKLFLSIDTVKTHRKNLMRKLDIKNAAGLVKYALENSERIAS